MVSYCTGFYYKEMKMFEKTGLLHKVNMYCNITYTPSVQLFMCQFAYTHIIYRHTYTYAFISIYMSMNDSIIGITLSVVSSQ